MTLPPPKLIGIGGWPQKPVATFTVREALFSEKHPGIITWLVLLLNGVEVMLIISSVIGANWKLKVLGSLEVLVQ
jgi:hypothetical protein